MARQSPDFCTTCGKPKTSEDFGSFVPKRGPNAGVRRLRTRCKECSAAYKRGWYARNSEKIRKAAAAEYRRAKERNPLLNRERDLRRTYGLSLADYDELSRRQGGVCAACKQPPADGEFLHVDHCHSGKIIRGLLCNACNRVLGFIHDDTARLFRLAGYLANPPLRIELPPDSRARNW